MEAGYSTPVFGQDNGIRRLGVQELDCNGSREIVLLIVRFDQLQNILRCFVADPLPVITVLNSPVLTPSDIALDYPALRTDTIAPATLLLGRTLFAAAKRNNGYNRACQNRKAERQTSFRSI